jgi:hypothetical protein
MILLLVWSLMPSVGWACSGNSDMLRSPPAVYGSILSGQCEPFLVDAL